VLLGDGVFALRRREGPSFVKIGSGGRSRVLYRLSDLDEWLESRRVETRP